MILNAGFIMSFPITTPILIVEDFKTMLRIMRNLLKQLGYEDVDDASDGAAALARMESRDYGLVISDWNMAPMTGFELLKQVRASARNSQIPFLMVTAESGSGSIVAAGAAGVSAYLLKPYNAQTLKAKMDEVYARTVG